MKRSPMSRWKYVLFLFSGIATGQAAVGPVPPWFPQAPSLPPPRGQVIRVATVEELRAAVDRIERGGTILLENGEYKLLRPVRLEAKKDLVIRSAAGDPGRVVLKGQGWESNARGDDLIQIAHC